MYTMVTIEHSKNYLIPFKMKKHYLDITSFDLSRQNSFLLSRFHTDQGHWGER